MLDIICMNLEMGGLVMPVKFDKLKEKDKISLLEKEAFIWGWTNIGTIYIEKEYDN